jgi:hypothetical protein
VVHLLTCSRVIWPLDFAAARCLSLLLPMPINQSPTSDRSSTNSSIGSGVNLFASSSHRAQLQITNPKTDKSDQYQSMTINQDALSKLCKQNKCIQGSECTCSTPVNRFILKFRRTLNSAMRNNFRTSEHFNF